MQNNPILWLMTLAIVCQLFIGRLPARVVPTGIDDEVSKAHCVLDAVSSHYVTLAEDQAPKTAKHKPLLSSSPKTLAPIAALSDCCIGPRHYQPISIDTQVPLWLLNCQLLL